MRSVPRMYDIDGIHKALKELRNQLLTEIEESKNTVKFDLLHDPSPQVDQLKASMT